jgi:hypothetical protein
MYRGRSEYQAFEDVLEQRSNEVLEVEERRRSGGGGGGGGGEEEEWWWWRWRWWRRSRSGGWRLQRKFDSPFKSFDSKYKPLPQLRSQSFNTDFQ